MEKELKLQKNIGKKEQFVPKHSQIIHVVQVLLDVQLMVPKNINVNFSKK